MIDKYEEHLLKIIDRLLNILQYRDITTKEPYWHYSYTMGDVTALHPTVSNGCDIDGEQ